MKLTSIILTGLLLFPAASWAQGSEPATVTGATEAKFLPPGLTAGDQIEVRLFDFPDVGSAPLRVRVSADGTVRLPYAGVIQAEGLSADDLQRSIVQALKSKEIVKEPNVSVDIISALNLNVRVIGEVRLPKSVPLFAPMPISFILSEVGGITGLASHHLTILHHSQEAPTSVDYDPDAPTSAAMNVLVQPGDIVSVSHMGVFFVGGEVLRPGVYPLGGAVSVGVASGLSGMGVVKQMTLLQALTQSGGVTQIAARSKMHILRTIDGKREDIVVDQVKLSKGEIADPILHADDIIYVPPSYIRMQTNNLFSTAIASLYAGIQVSHLP